MVRAYRSTDFHSFHDQPKVAQLEDVLILEDNFDHAIHLDPNLQQKVIYGVNKLSSTLIVMVCLEGHIDLSNNFRQYRLKKNDAIINRSGTVGELFGMSDDVKFMLIIVNNNFYFPTAISGDTSELQSITVNHPVCHLSEETASATLSIYNVLKERLNAAEEPLYIREMARGLVESFIFNIMSSLVAEVRNEQRQYTRLTRGQDVYNRFLELVEKNFMRERDIKFYADKLCLTPKYLSQIIYKESGNYAGDHIRHFVILEAKSLIRSRQYTISQICDMLNFTSQSFFTKYFKNATGMSPTEYQNS